MTHLLLSLSLFFVLSTHALGSFNSVFEKTYYDSYQEGKCGLNVLSFFKQLESLGEGVKGLNLVSLENKGFTVFGMVNAEKARANLHGKSTTQEKNWYHHKFAIDNNGMVYDFDYSNSPRPTPFNKYVEDMYLTEDECLIPKGGEFCAGRKNKLIDYELKIYEARDVLTLNDRPYWTGSLGQALDKFKP